jgi:magnesium transporter
MIENHHLCGGESFQWIDVVAPNDEEIRQIGDKYTLNPYYLQDVLQPEHLPKWEYSESDDMYFAIGRYCDVQRKGMGTIQQFTRKLAIFCFPDRIITIHRADNVPFLEELKDLCQLEGTRYSTPFLALCKIIKEVFKSYDPLLLTLSADLDFYEEKIFHKNGLPPFIKGLFELRRRITVARKVLMLSRTLQDCLRDHLTDPAQTDHNSDEARVQDAADMFLRMETIVDDLNDRVNNVINIHLAMSGQRSNEVMRVLTVFSAFFLPITFIAGVYGMNFEFMPELHWRYGYPASLALMAGIELLIFFWFKRKGWL